GRGGRAADLQPFRVRGRQRAIGLGRPLAARLAFHVRNDVLVEVGIVVAGALAGLDAMVAFVDRGEVTAMLADDFLDAQRSTLPGLRRTPKRRTDW
ncbi:hypothetical protein CWB79_22385, partial [Pseudoalteromonas sp. S1649]